MVQDVASVRSFVTPYLSQVERTVDESKSQSDPQRSVNRAASPADEIELSSAAQSQADAPLDEHVARVRAEIQSGDYLTDDKIDVVVDRLMDELLGE